MNGPTAFHRANGNSGRWVWIACAATVAFLAMVWMLAQLGSLPPPSPEPVDLNTARSSDTWDQIGTLLFGLFIYLVPSIVAHRRNHRNFAALAAANVLLGWTLIGWALCLVWALMASEESRPRA